MTTAREMLDLYVAAEKAVLSGQTVQLGDRRVTLADLAEIRAGREYWERRVALEERAASAAGSRPAVARWIDE